MKLTVLADNNTIIDRYYLGEPALCFWIEEGKEKILFDTGYSDVFFINAQKLGIDLSGITSIVISHGHNDHTGGLKYLLSKLNLAGTKLIAHPGVFARRRHEGLDVGSPVTLEECRACGLEVILSERPVKITERLTFLGEIPRKNGFEGKEAIGELWMDKMWTPDMIRDDSALLYEGKDGPFVIAGCSHSGICNIVSRALEFTGSEQASGVIGGFHLMRQDAVLKKTAAFLSEHVKGTLYPCHCVCLAAKIALSENGKVKEVGSGMTIEIN